MEPQKPKRITWANILESFLEIFNLRKGFLYTIRELLLIPGDAIHTYLFEDRSRLSKPFPFFILTTTLAVLIAINLDPFSSQFMEKGYGLEENGEANSSPDSAKSDSALIDLSAEADTLQVENAESIESQEPEVNPQKFVEAFLQEYFSKYMQVTYWLLLPVIALFSYLFFKKQKLFYPEHFVLNTYVAGMQNLMYVVLVPALMVFGGNTIYAVYFIGMVAYQIFAYIHIFKAYSKGAAAWKAVVVIMLSYILFFILFTIVLTVAMFIYIKSAKSGNPL